MSNEPPSTTFDDINEAVADEWVAETTPAERVRQVITHTYDPVSAATVSDDARTTPKTARKHLDTLAAEGYATTATGANGATTYRRSTESLVVEQAADLRERFSTDELAARIDDLRERLADYRDEYGVDSPAAVTVDGANQDLSQGGIDNSAIDADQPALDADTRRDWQTTRRNLAFATAALSIANAEQFVDGDDRSDDGVPV